MPQVPSPEDAARRVRAALGYANLKMPAAAEATGISKFTLARITSPTDPRGVDSDEIEAIATASGVPLTFFYEGFRNDDEATLGERLEAQDHRHRAEIKELRSLIEIFRGE